ncbi:MAG: hypothetical protein KJ950_14515 [Proteobacteria bacterium]|nr:hypothetical protein [Pseudomonadota bacterium]MBU1688890.1 hypothetical protein [Pseudomonadota bacterium]
MTTLKAERIKKPVLVPVAISIVILLVVSLLLVARLQRKNINDGVSAYIQSTKLLYDVTLKEEAELLRTLLNFYKDDKKLLMAFQMRDRKTLNEFALPIFEKIRSEYQVTHFYFIEPDKKCFLRMYNVDHYGDVIHRYTLDQAEKTGELQSGIELGNFGTLTLRVVVPWRSAGKLIGYIEFGKEIDNITPILKNTLGVELLLAVDTKHLDKELWKKGRQLMGHDRSSGMEMAGHVIIGRTMAEIPLEVARFLERPNLDQDQQFEVSSGKQYYRGGFTPLFDASGKNIGEIVALKDFSEAESSLQMLSGTLISLVIILLSFLSVCIYGVTGRVEKRLSRSREALQVEIAERAKAEEQIKASLEEKEMLIKEIHHRVKNNMQIVSSLFRLQLRQIDDPKALEILKDSQSRISTMALVHKTLYQPRNLNSISLHDYIRELALSIFDSYGVDPERISLKTDLETVVLDIDTVMPCGLIINELITNAIKYAFPDDRKGEISLVLAKTEGDEYVLSIRDNGVGIAKDLDIRRANSLGLQLVINLTENQLRGKVTLNREGGTEFVIRFREMKTYKKRRTKPV